MPKSLAAEAKWKLFLRTVTNIPSLNCTEINDTINFTVADYEDLQKIRKILRDPEQLKMSVAHAVKLPEAKVEPQKENVSKEESKPKVTLKTQYDNLSSLLYTLVDKEFITREIKIDESLLNQFVDDPLLQIATLKLTGTKAQIRRDVGAFEMLQSSLNDPKSLSAILYNQSNPITALADESSDFAQSILTISPDGVVTFNYGRILQTAQAAFSDPSDSPIIAAAPKANEVYEFSINKDYLLKYLYPHFNGLVFAPEESGQRAIMFAPDNQGESEYRAHKHHFEILVDVSGSMGNCFAEYKEKLIGVIEKIANQVRDWEMTIVTFSDSSDRQSFSSSNQISTIKEYIQGLSSKGQTALYKTMSDSLTELTKPEKYSTLIVFTDGKNNDPHNALKQSDVVELAKSVGQNNLNLMMYSMGLGECYDKAFFDTIARDGGFSHIDLKDLSEISVFDQHIGTIDNKRIVWEFITDQMKYIEKTASGDVSVSQHVIPKSTLEVNDGSNTFNIGVEEKEAEDNVSELASVGQEQGDSPAGSDEFVDVTGDAHNMPVTGEDSLMFVPLI
jgi:Mg-chelatase subunit ChlD